jgi:hypothetical protein
VKGFFSPKISYLIDVYLDLTGEERGSRRKTCGIIHRLQMRQNDAIHSAVRIKKKDHIGTESLLVRSGVIRVKEMSIRANCMMAWHLFAQYRDLQETCSTETCGDLQALDYGYESTNIQQELQLLGCCHRKQSLPTLLKRGQRSTT